MTWYEETCDADGTIDPFQHLCDTSHSNQIFKLKFAPFDIEQGFWKSVQLFFTKWDISINKFCNTYSMFKEYYHFFLKISNDERLVIHLISLFISFSIFVEGRFRPVGKKRKPIKSDQNESDVEYFLNFKQWNCMVLLFNRVYWTATRVVRVVSGVRMLPLSDNIHRCSRRSIFRFSFCP